MRKSLSARSHLIPLLALAAFTSACGGSEDDKPKLSAASPAVLQSCESLLQGNVYPATSITDATVIPAGTLKVAGKDIGEHCRVSGRMFDRVSAVDGQRYAIGFEIRMPRDWNGRFFYQANGGSDGNVVTATGVSTGGGPLLNGLSEGFAVLSSDAGHSSAQNPLFGLDPQSRLDFGYQAVGKLTPMAKRVVEAAYGKQPDRSYLVGCSNGGRHALVGAVRYADQYDGILAGHPGFNVPKSGVAMLYTAQQLSRVATDAKDPSTAFTQAERILVARKILDKCDALDGARDGIVAATDACQEKFDLNRDVPSCTGTRDGTCLSPAQKEAIKNIYQGPKSSTGDALYASFAYDPGLTSANWALWRFSYPTTLSAGNMAFVFQTPPAHISVLQHLRTFALSFDLDKEAPKIFATSGIYAEASMSFATPPGPADLSTLKKRGGKLIMYHGIADGTFSTNDTVQWYEGARTTGGGDGSDFSRLYLIPGMNHCGGGPATDQFDLLTPLVKWVEQGQVPEKINAQARGPGNAGGANADVPADWSPTRTRPLCAYPKIAQYLGKGSLESADSFSCQ